MQGKIKSVRHIINMFQNFEGPNMFGMQFSATSLTPAKISQPESRQLDTVSWLIHWCRAAMTVSLFLLTLYGRFYSLMCFFPHLFAALQSFIDGWHICLSTRPGS